jgi:hypothetical protein
MKYPWEFNYQQFMDTHIRVSVSINATKRMFAVLDEGINMNVEMVLVDGTPVTIKVEGHPRTTDPRITITELVNFLLTDQKR